MLTGMLILVRRPTCFAGTSRLQLALLKVALLLGVKLQVGKEHAFKSLAQADNYNVLILATSLKPRLLKTISAEAGDSMRGRLDYDEVRLAKTSVAVVAHFEASEQDGDATAWLKTAQTFDWSRQAFNFAPDSHEQQEAFKRKGYWAISRRVLEQDPDPLVQVQNIVFYPNLKAFKTIDARANKVPWPRLEDSVGVPATYYVVFTLEATFDQARLRAPSRRLP